MLIILNDPAGITGRQRHAWDHAASLQANVARHMASGAECSIALNGLEIDPLTDPRMDQAPGALDVAVVCRRPAGFDPLTIAIIVAVATSVLTVALLPKPPGADAAGKDSPNNRLTGQSNVARAYQAVPDVYGLRRVWPDLIQPSSVEYVDNIKFVTEWLCISRGRGTISAVQYAETPIGDISGSSYEVFEPAPSAGYPELSTTTISDVLETFASDEANGQEVAAPEPYVAVSRTGDVSAPTGGAAIAVTVPDGAALDQLKSRPAGAEVLLTIAPLTDAISLTVQLVGFAVAGGNATINFTAPAPVDAGLSRTGADLIIKPIGSVPGVVGPFTLPVDANRIRWNTAFLRGLKGSVTIRANWWRVDGAGVVAAGTAGQQDNTYTADTLDQRFYTNDATPAAGQGRYRIQFTRITAAIGDQGTDIAKVEEVYAVRHYPAKMLPGVTIIRVTTKATDQATGFSDRKFNLRWARHVRTLTSEVLSPSRNFARAIAHVWSLAGYDMGGLDVGALQAINAGLGEDSPLLRFDGSLDDADMSLGERMQLIAGTARCVVWRDGLRWTLTRDQARDYPELQLDYRNLARGGDSAISYSAHLPASNDGVEVEYVDEATQAKKAYVRLSVASGAPVAGQSKNAKKIKLLGCTTLAQAENRAQLDARRLLYQRTGINDTALSDANSLGIGSLVRWVDPNDFGGDDDLQAGEVMSAVGAVITTSEALNWKGLAAGRVLLTGADGRRLGPPIDCTPAPGGLTLATVPAGLYVADSVRQLGSRYAFAVGLTAAEVESAQLYTVTEVRPAGNGATSLACVNYDARIYEMDV